MNASSFMPIFAITTGTVVVWLKGVKSTCSHLDEAATPWLDAKEGKHA